MGRCSISEVYCTLSVFDVEYWCVFIFFQLEAPMNYLQFKITGTNRQTNRRKSLRIDAFSQDEAVEAASKKLSPPLDVERVPFDSPTNAQLDYAKDLGILVTAGMTKNDLTALISRSVDGDRSDPNPGLIDFATGRGFHFSQYIGKKALYILVFSSLDTVDKAAFFLFSVYRWLSEDREANLDKSPYCQKFYATAEALTNEERFVKSLNGYSGEELRFFGEHELVKGDALISLFGGSENTIAYKTASNWISCEFNTSKTRKKEFYAGQKADVKAFHSAWTSNFLDSLSSQTQQGVNDNYSPEHLSFFDKISLFWNLLVLLVKILVALAIIILLIWMFLS